MNKMKLGRSPALGKRLTGKEAGLAFRERVSNGKILPLIGVYDVFSALIVASRFEGVFCSGFSFAASAYGLPDLGFVNWRDMLDFATRVRHALPRIHVMVDVDDGFGDEVVAANTVHSLEFNGLSCVMMEDQKRPRKCGHFSGKEVIPVDEYLIKLKHVLDSRESIFVIARTDASDAEEGIRRAVAYNKAGADGVMVEAIRDLDVVRDLKRQVDCPIMVNQLHGGKTPNWSLDELEEAGASVAAFSSPCLFSAQYGIETYLDDLLKDSRLPTKGTTEMDDCVSILNTFLNGE